jgi:hypothetical protein
MRSLVWWFAIGYMGMLGLLALIAGCGEQASGKVYADVESLTFAPQLVNPTPSPSPTPEATPEPVATPEQDRSVRGPRKPAYPYRVEMDCVFLAMPFHKIETGAKLYLKIRQGQFLNKCWAEPPNSPSEPPEIANWGAPMVATEHRQDEARCNAIWFGREATRDAAASSACWAAYYEKWSE